MAVIIIGAGATRGASFVNSQKNPCLPPCDADFFTQLQRIKNTKHHELVRKVIADTVDLFGVNFRLTLENEFATLEHTIKMVEATGERRDFNRNDLVEKRDRLLQAIES